jgi:hypothetical protein
LSAFRHYTRKLNASKVKNIFVPMIALRK